MKKNASTLRSDKRRKLLRTVLAAAGWPSESAILTAFANGDALPPINPNITVSSDGNSSKESTKSGDIGG